MTQTPETAPAATAAPAAGAPAAAAPAAAAPAAGAPTEEDIKRCVDGAVDCLSATAVVVVGTVMMYMLAKRGIDVIVEMHSVNMMQADVRALLDACQASDGPGGKARYHRCLADAYAKLAGEPEGSFGSDKFLWILLLMFLVNFFYTEFNAHRRYMALSDRLDAALRARE